MTVLAFVLCQYALYVMGFFDTTYLLLIIVDSVTLLQVCAMYAFFFTAVNPMVNENFTLQKGVALFAVFGPELPSSMQAPPTDS